MRLEIDVRREHDKFLLQALAVRTQVVIVPEVILEGVVIAVVMRLSGVLPIAEKAALVPLATMFIKLIVVVEPLAAEGT